MIIINHLCLKAYSLIILLSLLTLLTYSISESLAQELVCPQRGILQITDGFEATSEDPSINADGRYVAFESSLDINDNNPNLIRQVYIFDTLTKVLTQITDDPNEPSFFPSINGDGTRVAFESESDINGGNPNNRRQIYIFDTTTDTFTQVTDDPDEPSNDPFISAPGNRVAFESEADINGINIGGNDEIFVFDTNTLTFIQITNEPSGDSINPSISADGNLVAFQSTANINGGNPNGIPQIYLANISTGIITQITSSTGSGSGDAWISADGNFITFESNDNLVGKFNDGFTKVFLYDVNANTITQITVIPGISQDPSINADGTVITFQSDANFNGNNSTGEREIWLFDTGNGEFTQVTDVSDGDSFHPVLNADGTRVAFDSRANINGGNPQEILQVFVATCLDPMTARNIPTLSEWGLIATTGLLGIIGLFAIRRRTVPV